MTDLERIQAIVARAADIDNISPETDIYDAGVTSMASMDVMVDLEAEFGIVLLDEEFLKARTCTSLLELVSAARGAQ